ncbi:hypothetical protein [Streptomyces lydicus]|uniref:hypothetical protein n=1 Tax=Streptomyces lydicus TaxID=47763 RepID=UPI0010107F03|nr:hypothetical protein [Streptomyces lydicus]MCZ1012135.1 hypothetical protein [Streptomyces lydicus]
MTTRETLPELIHRLVESKGRAWVERELDYGPDVIDHHLSSLARRRARQAPRPGSADRPADVSTEPLRLIDLALHLHVRVDTLSRALRNDPAAPAPAPGTDGSRWFYAAVHAWWPNRRKRGQRAGYGGPTLSSWPSPEGEGDQGERT